MLSARVLQVTGAAIPALLSALVLAVPAYAAFPGRDGRITWLESEYTDVGGGFNGDTFFVVQHRLGTDSTQSSLSMQCYQGSNDNPEELCPFSSAEVSPDGRTIAVGVTRELEDGSRRRANLALDEANGGGGDGEALPDLSEADRDPAWSPDGQQLVFVGQEGDFTDLFIVDRDGQNLRQLTFDGQVEAKPVWSRRGEIAFQRGLGISTVRADGTGLRQLTGAGINPDWSPKGRRLIFQRGRRLFTVSRAGRRLRRVAGKGSYPAWSPSGRRIAFRRRYDIYTAKPDGTRRRRVYDWPAPRNRRAARRHAPRHISWAPRQR